MRSTREFNFEVNQSAAPVDSTQVINEKPTKSFEDVHNGPDKDIPVEPVKNYSAVEYRLPARYWVFVDTGMMNIDDAVVKYRQELKETGADFDPLG